MAQPLYVFDLDETLIDGDCAMIWNEFLVDQGVASSPGFLDEDKRLMAVYAQGDMNMEDYLSFSMSPLAAMPKGEVMALVEQCVESRILPQLYPNAKSLITQLTQESVPMLIISASIAFLVKAVATRIGVQQSIGIDLVEKNGCFTHQVLGTPSYREGKVIRLQQWLREQAQPFSEIHFYTDSINDLPLCLFADQTYLVNPCEQLIAHAQVRQWPILSWSRSASFQHLL